MFVSRETLAADVTLTAFDHEHDGLPCAACDGHGATQEGDGLGDVCAVSCGACEGSGRVIHCAGCREQVATRRARTTVDHAGVPVRFDSLCCDEALCIGDAVQAVTAAATAYRERIAKIEAQAKAEQAPLCRHNDIAFGCEKCTAEFERRLIDQQLDAQRGAA